MRWVELQPYDSPTYSSQGMGSLETYHAKLVSQPTYKRVKTPNDDIHMVWVGVARQSPSYDHKLPSSNLPASNFPTDKLPASNLPASNLPTSNKTIRIATANSLYRARSPTGNGSHFVVISCCDVLGVVYLCW